jgi:tRNA 2-thiouridine synthesizing protein A
MATTGQTATVTIEADKPGQAPAADRTLDLRGLSCPLPPLKTLQALRRMRSGEVLEVLGNNPIGNRSTPLWARVLGSRLLQVVPEEGFKRFFYRKA